MLGEMVGWFAMEGKERQRRGIEVFNGAGRGVKNVKRGKRKVGTCPVDLHE